MTKFISTNDLIKQLAEKGVDMGKGDPYNRLRYYTKIGWLPNMKRVKDSDGNILGHYPIWVIDRILKIEDLKNKKYSKEYISKELNTFNPETLSTYILSSDFKKHLGYFLVICTLFFLIVTQVLIYDKQTQIYTNFGGQNNTNFIQNGKATLKKGEKTIFVPTLPLSNATKILVAFETNDLPTKSYWVQKDSTKMGFNLNLDTPFDSDQTFYWWLSR